MATVSRHCSAMIRQIAPEANTESKSSLNERRYECCQIVTSWTYCHPIPYPELIMKLCENVTPDEDRIVTSLRFHFANVID